MKTAQQKDAKAEEKPQYPRCDKFEIPGYRQPPAFMLLSDARKIEDELIAIEKERDMLRDSSLQLTNMAVGYRDQIEELKLEMARMDRTHQAVMGELQFNADKLICDLARVQTPTDKPTEPGWYWLESNEEWTIVHLRLEANGSLKANSLFPVNELKGRWYRILPPIPLRPSLPSVQPLPFVPTT